jgi:hypothetical protein
MQEGAAAGKSEAERLEAAWAHKSTLSRGLSMFTTSPVKAVKYLISQQIMDSTPEVSQGCAISSCGLVESAPAAITDLCFVLLCRLSLSFCGRMLLRLTKQPLVNTLATTRILRSQ